MTTRIPIALYIPNILGYLRILLAVWGLYVSHGNPMLAVALFILSASLDLIDGILARALNQTSSLGVLLDIAADNILRTCGWVAAAMNSAPPHKNPGMSLVVVVFIICLEWITMLCTQLHAAHSETHWKTERSQDPWLVRALFANNFRNPIGMLAMYGLFSASLWCYGSGHPQLHNNIPFFDTFKYLAYVGRGLSMAVELWMVKGYLSLVISQDTKSHERSE